MEKNEKWNGKLYGFIGNIICELKEGKGLMKMYNEDNVLIHEEEYLNGEINGKVREFNEKGQLTFEGEFLDGKRNGKVKEYFKNKLKYEREYLYDQKIKGKDYIEGILEYEGEYLFDKKWNGKGYDEKGNITYKLIHGNGKVKYYYGNGK